MPPEADIFKQALELFPAALDSGFLSVLSSSPMSSPVSGSFMVPPGMLTFDPQIPYTGYVSTTNNAQPFDWTVAGPFAQTTAQAVRVLQAPGVDTVTEVSEEYLATVEAEAVAVQAGLTLSATGAQADSALNFLVRSHEHVIRLARWVRQLEAALRLTALLQEHPEVVQQIAFLAKLRQADLSGLAESGKEIPDRDLVNDRE